MATGDKLVNIVNKRLMGKGSFKDYFLDYLGKKTTDLFARVYNKDGTFRDTAISITSSGNDEINLPVTPGPVVYGTDGSGNLLILPNEGSSQFNGVPFENQTGNDYDVGLHYAEKPSGIHLNPRTGKPEYMRWEEKIGVADEPVSVVDQGGGVFRFRLPASMCPGDRTCAGRGWCWLWKKVPGDAALTEEIALVKFTIAFSTYNYIDVDTATNDFGQTTFSEEETDYMLMLEGPTIARTGDLDIEAADDYWYIGEVTGNGPAATPTVFDMSDQNLIIKSLSDLVLNLVYDNVVNTFTRRQNFYPSTDELAARFYRDMDAFLVEMENQDTGNNGGVLHLKTQQRDALRVDYDYDGTGQRFPIFVFWEGTGPLSGAAIRGQLSTALDTNAHTAAGYFDNARGIGLIAQGRSSNPARGALKIYPANGVPSGPSDGEHWGDSGSKTAGCAVGGNKRIYAEEQKSRSFYYPLSCAQPYWLRTFGDAHWFFHVPSRYWISDDGPGVEGLCCDLNRFLPQGVTLTEVRARVIPANSRGAQADQLKVELLSSDTVGGDQKVEAREYSGSGTSALWVYLKWAGDHTGSDNQSVLTDSSKNWAVDELVGRTIYNDTDGSSGTITANTANTVTATLSGGDNDWDNGDTYRISGDLTLAPSESRMYWVVVYSGNDTGEDQFYSMQVTYTEGSYLRAP